jgi:hypothetical protein
MLGPGCAVRILGRSGIRYREGENILLADGEMLSGSFDFVVYTNSIRAWEGSEVALTEERRQQIVGNMKAVFSSHGLHIDFVP